MFVDSEAVLLALLVSSRQVAMPHP